MIDDLMRTSCEKSQTLPAPGKERKGGIEIRRRKELGSVLCGGVPSSWETEPLPRHPERSEGSFTFRTGTLCAMTKDPSTPRCALRSG